ncbi:PREDICTED: uncharacterized protein LOC109229978 [Nicotiana attenuata]|uniref:uncharacterized protein LOC109229978 n=1 Tax=Nicotiana attenuata TaxID=49451 RepID=UPI0009050CB6|nr:PREDICTED: uncharacterized protein LOC109229978 [Nicotiana attenuata]
MEPQTYDQQQDNSIPPKPPDIDPKFTKPSFKDMLITQDPMLFANLGNDHDKSSILMDQDDQSNTQSLLPISEGIKCISLSPEDKTRIYEPWKHAIIIKLVGKRMLHHYLKKKIQELWKPSEDFQLIDLGMDYYIIKLKKKENMEKAMQQGPWFINGYFLSIIHWKPNFVATKERVTKSAVWIRLPRLPTEFYDAKILEKIGNAIGRLLKIDVCTSTTLRGRYARLCVELSLDMPVQPSIYVGHHKQTIHYEGENFLCTKCGRLGHIAQKCPFFLQLNKNIPNEITCKDPPSSKEGDQEVWTTVSF